MVKLLLFLYGVCVRESVVYNHHDCSSQFVSTSLKLHQSVDNQVFMPICSCVVCNTAELRENCSPNLNPFLIDVSYITLRYITHTPAHPHTPHFLWSAVWGQQAWVLPSGAPLCQQLCHPSAVIHQRPCPSSPPRPETGTQVCVPALLVRCVHPLPSLNLSISEVCVCATFHELWCWPAGLSLSGVGWNKADMAVLSFVLLRPEMWGGILESVMLTKAFLFKVVQNK